MSRSTLLIILMFGSMVSYGQNISVTFTGTGAATQIDSVTATNLRTNQSVTLPGNETLILTVNTGIPSVSELANMGIVFPNPFSGNATFNAIVNKPQMVFLKVLNFVGQVVVNTKAFVQAGENEFALSLNIAGIYIISLTTEQGTTSYRVICTEANETENWIQYIGSTSGSNRNPTQSGLKSFQTGYVLGYTFGDVILYWCRSGIYTTIKTDSPTTSKNYDVEFVACTDPDGKSYSIVKIGDQTWMGENLAFLPSVSSSSSGSENSTYYYVYGYEDSRVNDAKVNPNYTTYGVLYNWEAAKTACPSGWRLPSDGEWKVLETYLGMSQSDAEGDGWRTSGTVGRKLKEAGTSHWISPNIGATNSSGFTALPGGYRRGDGGFASLGTYAAFWSASEIDASGSWSRGLYCGYDGVGRYSSYRSYGFSVRCLKDGTTGDEKPVVTTSPSQEVNNSSAKIGGEVTSAGSSTVSERGVYFGTTSNPKNDGEKIQIGSGIGVFSISRTGLTERTPYYYQAYATNQQGTGFGEVVSFTTTGGTGGDGTFTDSRDGHVYQYKTIGSQTWMAENLALLPSVSYASVGSSTSTDPYFYVYGYEGSTVASAQGTANYLTYGVLYNWPAAMNGASSSNSVPSNVKGICPSGWHLPSDAEWTILTDYLGSGAGTKMKATSGWNNDGNGDNSSGFTALPGGYRGSGGSFSYLGSLAYFWSSSENDASDAWDRGLGCSYDGVNRNYASKSYGVSVRCLQNN